MDRGAWWATVHGGSQRVRNDWETKTTNSKTKGCRGADRKHFWKNDGHIISHHSGYSPITVPHHSGYSPITTPHLQGYNPILAPRPSPSSLRRASPASRMTSERGPGNRTKVKTFWEILNPVFLLSSPFFACFLTVNSSIHRTCFRNTRNGSWGDGVLFP